MTTTIPQSAPGPQIAPTAPTNGAGPAIQPIPVKAVSLDAPVAPTQVQQPAQPTSAQPTPAQPDGLLTRAIGFVKKHKTEVAVTVAAFAGMEYGRRVGNKTPPPTQQS